MYKKTTLKNGLRIITIPMKNTQTITVLILVGTGSKYETKENNGISHFLEHMLLKGTKKKSTPLKIAEPLDRIGGIYDAFTGDELTGYWAKTDFKHLNIALDWISDIYLNSKLEKKEIEKEKGTIIEEINMYLDRPIEYIGVLWEKLLYGDQPAGWQTLGEKKIILKLKRRNFLDCQKNHYSAKNTIICVAGNIDSKSCEKKVEKYFKKKKKFFPKSKLKTIEKQTEPQILIYPKKTDQAHLCLGVRGYDIFHPQKHSQDILATILGEMMSSRLFIEIREKKGLAYYIHTDSENSTDTGYLVTQAGVKTEKTKETIKIILKEYKKLSEKKVPETELQKAKNNIKGKMALVLESSNSQASFYGMQELLENKILSPKQIYAKIDNVTSNDILKISQDIFQPAKLNLTIIGPFKKEDEKEFLKILKDF